METKQAQVIEFTIKEATDALIAKARQLDKTLPTKIDPMHIQIVGDQVRLTVIVPVDIGQTGEA